MDIPGKKGNVFIPSPLSVEAIPPPENTFPKTKLPKALQKHYRFQPPPVF